MFWTNLHCTVNAVFSVQNLPKEGVNWFSLVTYTDSSDLACYGSDKGIQFVQQTHDTLQKFRTFVKGTLSFILIP